MIDSVSSKIINATNCRLEEKISEKFIDIHCHCLPGLDDGPSTMSVALALCQQMAIDGITTAVATPHQLGRFEGRNEAASVREAVHKLNQMLRNHGIYINILPGGEVRVDERICQLLKADEILTLADGGRYILLELPHQIFIDIEPLLQELITIGIRPIISHAERIAAFTKQPHLLLRWLEHPIDLQITTSSLLGDFGDEAKKAAWNYITSGWARIVATDSHDLDSRKPNMKAAFRQIRMKLGEDLARLICFENPLRVINGQDILSVSFSEEVGR